MFMYFIFLFVFYFLRMVFTVNKDYEREMKNHFLDKSDVSRIQNVKYYTACLESG